MQREIPMLEHLRPQYAKSFHCLGGSCVDNCCQVWEVVVDKPSYQRYERNPALQPHMKEYFSLITDGATERRHAAIQFTPSSRCPFLSTERLCSLQKQYGADYPPEGCVQYPRNPHRVDGLLEQPLSLSCIEAARLVLLNPKLMAGKEIGRPAYSRLLTLPDQVVPSGREFRYFWDVRELCLLLVQDRTYPLWQRLFLLGMFCKRLGDVVGAQDFGRTPKLVRDYAEIASSGKLRAEMDGIPVRSAAQVQMVVQVAFGYLRQQKAELCRIQECLQDFLDGVGYEGDSGLENCARRYGDGYREYYEPFMQEHPHLLENYLINHIFRVMFPFGQDPEKAFERPQHEFLLMCLEFAVLKGLLIGMAGHYREAFSQEHVVKLVQSLAKSFEHDLALGGTLNWQGLSDVNCVAALLKN